MRLRRVHHALVAAAEVSRLFGLARPRLVSSV